MSTRRTRLVDCNPRWATRHGDERRCYLMFDCPEGHHDCSHAIPFTPALDGSDAEHAGPHAVWHRAGDTFETLTLSPSIRRNPTYANHEAAIAAGALPQYLNDSHFCAFHGFIGGSSGQSPGAIEFCGDSR